MGDYIFCLAVAPVVAWGVWVCVREPRHLAPTIRDTRELWTPPAPAARISCASCGASELGCRNEDCCERIRPPAVLAPNGGGA